MTLRSAARSVFVALTLLAAAAPARADEIKVFSSVAMRTVVEALAPRFERDTGHRVVTTFGLAAALKNRIEAVELRAGIEVELLVEGSRVLPLDVETDLFRIAQEALTNILKHAQASRVKVQLFLADDLVRLIIQDNGIGFDLQEPEASKGFGLHSLRERVQRMGGSMRIETAPGQGTKLVVEL